MHCLDFGQVKNRSYPLERRGLKKTIGIGLGLNLNLFGNEFFVLVFGEVAAVAEWLKGGFATSTKSDAVSNLIGLSVCGFDGDAASHPDWAAAR